MRSRGRCMLRSRAAGLILQVLLAGGTYRRTFGELWLHLPRPRGVTMIGAMPAVAVRHERRKQEKRSKRPSQLHLGGLGIKHTSPPSRGSSPTPSPLQSPPPQPHFEEPVEFYVCGKVSVLHMVVVSLLLGAILLIVGLVQLTPGADASDHRYYLIATGSFLMLLGLLLTAGRCWFLPRRLQTVGDPVEIGAIPDVSAPPPDAADVPPRVSVSSSGGVLTSPSEHDALINSGNGHALEKVCTAP